MPEHWELRRLRTSVDACVNGIWGADPDGRHDIVCVRVADFDRVRRRVDLSRQTIRAIGPSERNGRLLNKGDLLIEKSGGGDSQPVGTVVMYDHAAPAVCSNFVARMSVSPNSEPRYLTYLHSSLYNRRLNVRSIKQTTGIQNLDSHSYLNERVAFPPFAEQKSIVRFLDHADRRIRRYILGKRNLIALLDEQLQAVICEAVMGRIDVRTGRPYPLYTTSETTWLSRVPKHWDVLPLCAVATPKSVTGKQDMELLSVYLDRGVIRFSEERDKRTNVTSEDLSKYQSVDPGDFVLNNQQAWRGSVGVSQHYGIVSPAYLVLSLSHEVNGDFANRLFRSRVMVAQYVACSRGVGTIQRNIYWSHLRRAVFPSPPLTEQIAIAGYLDQISNNTASTTALIRREMELVDEYRNRIIADTVTGKLDVRSVETGLPAADRLR